MPDLHARAEGQLRAQTVQKRDDYSFFAGQSVCALGLRRGRHAGNAHARPPDMRQRSMRLCKIAAADAPAGTAGIRADIEIEYRGRNV